ncbi:MAG: hypothetical protein ACI35S_05440 [Anaeroplasma sp.]
MPSIFDEPFNKVLSIMINKQVNLSQPIYVISSFWLGHFNGFTGMFTTNGDSDLEEIKKLFMERYSWKPHSFGVTEQSFKLVRIDIKCVLDAYGGEVLECE